MRRSIDSNRISAASSASCRHCKKKYWELLPACPYCGTSSSSVSENGESISFIDPRQKMRITPSWFYYFFIILSVFLGILIILHDIFFNIINGIDLSALMYQFKLKIIFWILYPIHQLMFCYWIYVHHAALKDNLRVMPKLSSKWAVSLFIPVLNLYFPKALVSEIEDTMYNLKVRDLKIRFVGVWWFFQVIAYLYLLVSSYIDFENELFWIVVICELCWGVALLFQSILIHNFQTAMEGISRKHGSRSLNSSRERSSRRER